jgi:hypothetical protein
MDNRSVHDSIEDAPMVDESRKACVAPGVSGPNRSIGNKFGMYCTPSVMKRG